MKTWSIGVAVLLSACVINGKKYGPGSSSPSSSSSGGSSSSGDTYNPSDAYSFYTAPYPTAPADPWAAVSGDQPVRGSAARAEHWKLRGKPEVVCSAKIDHCLDKDAWFIVEDRAARNLPATEARWTVFDAEGRPAQAAGGRSAILPYVGDKEFTAFRTVPATRANLKPGTPVIVLKRDEGVPKSEQKSYDAFWTYGIVEEVDAEGGFFLLKNSSDTFKPAAARVVVLSWRPGGKVEIVGGKSKTELAIKASDVFLPE